MRNVSIVKDKIDGTPFAVIVIDRAKKISAFGSKGQGETWADWVNASEMSFDEAVSSLDISLIADKPSPASSANTEELAKFMRPEEVLDLQSEISKKSILEIVETKSLDPIQHNDEEDLPDFTPVSEWPITDIEIAAIDVSYKQNAVDYKAKAFMAEKNISSLMYEVKGYRAIWDPNISSWRCPEDTLNGGQFTNRMGRGCTTGMVRRLGQFLMSLEDRNTLQPMLPGIEEPRTALYRAGKIIDSRAEASREKFVGKMKNRANRRQQRANLNPRFTDLYGALNPDKPALARARTAAGLRLQRIGNNMAQRGFVEMDESGRRKARRLKKAVEAKFPGGSTGRRLREEGGIIPNSRLGGYVIKEYGVAPRFIDLNEMTKNSSYLKGLDNVLDRDGNEIPNPVKGFNYITRKEAAEIIQNHQIGLIRNSENNYDKMTADLSYFSNNVRDLIVGRVDNDWDSLSTGKTRPDARAGKVEFLEYDELQAEKAKFAKGSRHSEMMRLSQRQQSFSDLEELDAQDPRVQQFQARLDEVNSSPIVRNLTGLEETYIAFAGETPGAGRKVFMEASIPGKQPVAVLADEKTGVSLRRNNMLSLQDASMDTVTLQADHYDDNGNYLFTAVHSVKNGGTTNDIQTKFYAVASKPDKSIEGIEAKKSVKDGEISQHFRTFGGKNPLTDRGGFVSVNFNNKDIDLDQMIPLNESPGVVGVDGVDWSDEIVVEMEAWRAKGWKYVSRDEWHEMENRVMEKVGVSRKDYLPKKNGSTTLNGLGGDSPILNMASLSRYEDADVSPESYVRAFSAKDLQHMIDTKNIATMSHLNDDVWKKAIRRKEKESGIDVWGEKTGSEESRLNRIRQNLASFIETFDPLADEDTRSRRMRRRVEKRSSKGDRNLPDATNAKDVFGGADEEGKLNIEKLLDSHRNAMDNFNADIAARGRYKGTDERNQALFGDSNQEAGKPTPEFERVKQLIDDILDDNDVFGADPSSVQNHTLNGFISRMMNEASFYAMENGFRHTNYPVISLTNFRLVEKTDGAGTKKVAVRELISITPYMMETPDSDPSRERSESGLFSLGIHTTEISDLTDAEIAGIEAGDIQFDDLRDRFTEATGGKRNNSAFRRGFPADSTELGIVFDRDGDPLVIDGESNTVIPYRGSRNDRVDITTGGVSGKITTPKGAELEKEDDSADIGESPSFWNSGKKRQKRRAGRRSNTGTTPETPGIIERFLTGEGRRWAREREAAERLQQGRMPRSTDSIRERFFKRLGQISNRMKGEEDPIDLYPTIPSRVNYQDLRTRIEGPGAIWGGFGQVSVLPGLRQFPIPPNQNSQDWKNNADNIRRITDLSDSLESLGGWRPRITLEDREREAELTEMYKEWQMDLHNPDRPTLPGSDSNFAHAIVAEDPSPNYDRITIYDTRQEHYPPVAIIDAKTGTAHLLGKDGKHLMSIVETDDVNGNRIIVPIIGPGARQQFEERERIPGFIERMTGKFRKRKPRAVNTPAGSPQRLTKRGVVRSKSGRTGIFYPQRSKGDYIQSLDSLTPSQITLLSNAVASNLESLEKDFRRHLKLSDADELLEDDILDHIDDLAKAGNGRLAGIRKSALHDMLVLADAKESNDLMLINDLKPSRRNSIISTAGIKTGIDTAKTRPFTPYGPNRPSNTATAVTPTPGAVTTPGAPIDLNPPTKPSAPRAPRTVTGPALTPGVGNPSLGISFKNGVYVDDATGELVEDLSGLDVSADMVYTPHSVDTDGYFPSVPVPGSIPGIRPQRIIKLAPGVDQNHPDILGGNDPRRAIQIESVTQTFDEAAQALTEAKMDVMNIPMGMGFAEDLPSLGFDIGQNRDGAILRAAVTNSAQQNGLYKDFQGMVPHGGTSMDASFMDSIGIAGPGPVRDIYLPSPMIDDASSDMWKAAATINKALKAEHIASEMESLLRSGNTSAWDNRWGTPTMAPAMDGASPELNITPDNVRKARERADAAWAAAATGLANIQQANALKSNTALQTIRLRGRSDAPVDRAELTRYVRNGQAAEMAEHLLRKHVLSDPAVMEGLAAAKREQMETAAKRTNARMRARANRAAAGRRNVGQLDDAIDPATGNLVLDIHGNGQVSNAPQRTVQEIMDIHAEHRADGALEPPTIDPVTGVVQDGILDDEDIELLSAMGRAHTDFVAGNSQTAGHPDLVGTDFHDVGAMMMGSWWQYSGYSSLPLLLDEKEIESLLDDVGPDGIPNAIAITRGIKDVGNTPAGDLIEQNLRGDRFIVGQGASASGRGEYWTGEPSSWASYHATKRGSQIAVITRNSKIMTTDVADTLFTGSGGGMGDSLLYGALWALANAHGAPDFGGGVNTGHGNQRTFGVPENSLLPDPNTGLYDIPALQAVVDKMTDLTPGQEGIATIEGWNNANNLPSWLAKELFPGSGASADLVEEAKEQRQQWNAWLGQHLSWFVQIAQMARDESQPGQAGIDAKEWNKKLNEARRTLLYMSRENRLALMGYDAIVAGSRSEIHQKALPSSLWKDPKEGLGTKKTPHVILVLNRSAGMYYRMPTEWRAFKDRLNNNLKNLIPW